MCSKEALCWEGAIREEQAWLQVPQKLKLHNHKCRGRPGSPAEAHATLARTTRRPLPPHLAALGAAASHEGQGLPQRRALERQAGVAQVAAERGGGGGRRVDVGHLHVGGQGRAGGAESSSSCGGNCRVGERTMRGRGQAGGRAGRQAATGRQAGIPLLAGKAGGPPAHHQRRH